MEFIHIDLLRKSKKIFNLISSCKQSASLKKTSYAEIGNTTSIKLSFIQI
jgi:hypothetical protein